MSSAGAFFDNDLDATTTTSPLHPSMADSPPPEQPAAQPTEPLPPTRRVKGVSFATFTTSYNVVEALDQSSAFASNVFGTSHNEVVNKKNRRMERSSFVLLLLLGIAAGLVNGLILWINYQLCQFQAWVLNTYGQNYSIGLLYFLLSSCGFVFIAATLCKSFGLAAAGSGLPEFKALLAKSDLKRSDYSRLVSVRILVTKIVGLIFSVGSCLSVGTEGPLVHVAACIAFFLISRIHEFEFILDSPNLAKQVFAASAAVGISSAFNAPVGGLLFSVEVTTTFYLIANYWKSCVAAAAGAAACYLILPSDNPLKLLSMDTASTQFTKWELIVFALIGVFMGYAATAFLFLHQKVNVLFRPYNKSHPIALAVTVAFCTSMLVYISGSYGHSVGIIALTSDVVNTGKVQELQRFGVNPIGGLFASFLIRTLLTLVCTNIAVPAGIFMPVFLIGGLFGRFLGSIIATGTSSINVPSYALVGAVGFGAGVTQTVSVAVIGVELTGNINLLLPLLIVSVISAGISRICGLSIYDRGMLNKGLESFQLLLTDTGGYRYAAEVMQPSVCSITKRSTVLKLLVAMQGCRQSVYPVIDHELVADVAADTGTDGNGKEGNMLIGTVKRSDVYCYLKKLFIEVDALSTLESLLPVDSKENKANISAVLKREDKERRRKELQESMQRALDRTEVFTANLIFNDALPAVNRSVSSPDLTEVEEEEERRSRMVVADSDIETARGTGASITQIVHTAAGHLLGIAVETTSETSDNAEHSVRAEELLTSDNPALASLVLREVNVLLESCLQINTFTHRWTHCDYVLLHI